MKPYLFLSGLLLGTSISMSSLADTHVVDASCNDARYGACTSATTDDSTICDFNIDEDVYQGILGFSPAHSRSMLENVLVVSIHSVVIVATMNALVLAFPIGIPLALSLARPGCGK